MQVRGDDDWIEQGYKQVKDELGWADFQVRSATAIHRHQVLVCCAFSFCWDTFFDQPTPPDDPAPPPDGDAGERGSRTRPAASPTVLVQGLLNRTLIWNHEHLRQILHDYELHHNTHRPHMSLSAAAPLKPLPPNVTDLDALRVRRTRRAGGLINEYRTAA